MRRPDNLKVFHPCPFSDSSVVAPALFWTGGPILLQISHTVPRLMVIFGSQCSWYTSVWGLPMGREEGARRERCCCSPSRSAAVRLRLLAHHQWTRGLKHLRLRKQAFILRYSCRRSRR